MRVRCIWRFGVLFRQFSERIITQIRYDAGVIGGGWEQPVAFPKAQRPFANTQDLSGFRLADARAKPFRLEGLAECCRLL